jgi:hypothetical protein
MAQLTIQGKSIEMETYSYSHADYYAVVTFNTSESEASDFCKSIEIPLSGDSRRDITFSHVEEEINEYFNEHHPDIEIVNFKSINIEEREKIKQRPYDNYEY